MKIPLKVSARHIHLSNKDKEILFGKNYQLTHQKNLSQPKQFATKETVRIIGPKNQLNKVRIIGPVRKKTQLELSLTDAYQLGLVIPIRLSGNLQNSAGKVKLVGPQGKISLKNGVIAAQRHLHIEPDLAKKLNINHGQSISVQTKGVRRLIFQNVIVRSRQDVDRLSLQIDVDEANAAGVKTNDLVELI